jgi:hypothetical protein
MISDADELSLDFEDEVIAGACITRGGRDRARRREGRRGHIIGSELIRTSPCQNCLNACRDPASAPDRRGSHLGEQCGPRATHNDAHLAEMPWVLRVVSQRAGAILSYRPRLARSAHRVG